ncbi:MAG: geranylgeranylglyceryl/heptaprenylglyceryl phosphate synthase [Thermoplasmata archaeon]|nr:geranylgeranylglyceryl/heptaprenylglyceryl phosphate synthase [Thermoplasmata archaeon]
MGRVFDYLHRELEGGPLHLTLIDPDKSPGEKAAAIAEAAVKLGSHAILLGGSTGITPEVMGAAASAIRTRVPVPTIIFPEGPRSLTPAADAVFFMSLLNSRNLDLVIRAHARAAPMIRAMKLEPLSLGYLVIAPGMRVGEVGAVDAVDREDLASAEGFALAAEMLGMRFVYLEAGSGAPSPVPDPMIRAVRRSLSIPLIVGGGIRSAADARGVLDAGAQILVTGTVTETEGIGSNFRGILAEVVRDRGH